MVLIKRDISVNLNLKRGGDLGEFSYEDSAIENLNQSEGLRNLVFQIFRKVGRLRTPQMKKAIENYSSILHLTKNKLIPEESKDFLAKDYTKALKRFLDDVEETKLKELLQIAESRGYLSEEDDTFEALEKLEFTIGDLDNEGLLRRELKLPLGEMTDEPKENLLRTSLARAFLENENLAPARDYSKILEYMDIKDRGENVLLIFRAKDYLHELLDTNGYLEDESTPDNVVVREGLDIPVVHNRGSMKKPAQEEEELSEEEEEKARQREEERGIASDIEADMAIEDDSEGITETGEDDLEDLEDEAFAEAMDERMKKKSYILKADEEEEELTSTPTGLGENILSAIAINPKIETKWDIDEIVNVYTLYKPDGTEKGFKTANDVTVAAQDITLTKTILEKLLKGKKTDTAIHRLIHESLQPSEGEITVKNYSLKIKTAGDNLVKQVLELGSFQSTGEYPETSKQEILDEIKTTFKEFLKAQVKFHQLLKTSELKDIFYRADDRQEFLDAMIEYRHSKRDEDLENVLPLEDYNQIMSIVGGMTMREGSAFDPKQTRPKGYGTEEAEETTPKGKRIQYASFPKQGGGQNSPFGAKGQDKTKDIIVFAGEDEEKMSLIIPRFRGVTPSVDTFAEAIYDANFMKKPGNKITVKRTTAELVPNRNLEWETVAFGKGQKMKRPKGKMYDYKNVKEEEDEYEYSDAEMEAMQETTDFDTRGMVKVLSVSEDIVELEGKPLFVNFRPYKKQRQTTERDMTPIRNRYSEHLLSVLKNIKRTFDGTKKQIAR